MTEQVAEAAFESLFKLAQASRQNAVGLPEQEEAIQLWSGTGFRIGKERYVAPMGAVIEILHLPKCTKIPGVQSWMYGAANVRGRLLPILDIGLFFEQPEASFKSRSKRVMVIEKDDLLSGIIVDGIQGMQYFSAESFRPSETSAPKEIAPFVAGSYEKNDSIWNVFNTEKLIQNDRFMDVSLGATA